MPLYHIPHGTDIQLPDKLTITDKLPVEWLPTSMYTKAALWLYKHNNGKTPYAHQCSENRYLVLTAEGAETYKKITKTLVKRYARYHALYLPYLTLYLTVPSSYRHIS